MAQESGAPEVQTIADVIFQLQALQHIHACGNCRSGIYRNETHFTLWRGEDYITCLRLADNRFLTFDEYLDYVKDLAKAPRKEEHSEIAAVL